MLIRLSLFVTIVFVRKTTELIRGRDAKPGEFPFIVRILIAEHTSHEDDISDEGREGRTGKKAEYEVDKHTLKLMHSYGDKFQSNTSKLTGTLVPADMLNHRDHDGAVSAGVLITASRVLTTCDSVGFFAGQKVNLYSLHKVSVMAGSVKKTGEGGRYETPSTSNVHPLCYFLTTKMSVLFNYGVYEFATPFDSLMAADTNVPLIAPIINSFQSKHEMEVVLHEMTSGTSDVKCFAAGWGNHQKVFEGRGMPDFFERFSDILQTTSMKIVDYSECDEATCINFDECLLSVWESGYVCAAASVGGPCNEDNGAPLVCDGEVFGILINPKRCTNTGHPRLFLRIDLAFNYVFDVKSASTVNTVTTRYAVLEALVIVFIRRAHGV